MFSPGMPSGFSMYESGDGGRSSARGRESDGGRRNRSDRSGGVLERFSAGALRFCWRC